MLEDCTITAVSRSGDQCLCGCSCLDLCRGLPLNRHTHVRVRCFLFVYARIEGGHGIWNMPSNPEDNQGIGRGTPTENYPVVKATNADAAVWGDLLIKSKQ